MDTSITVAHMKFKTLVLAYQEDNWAVISFKDNQTLHIVSLANVARHRKNRLHGLVRASVPVRLHQEFVTRQL
uniref:Uncharacterized protein n=1 Tax=Anguilla anguilla TaxID=7936 RepID=A0A0E9QLA7_ANGAN